MSDDFDYGTLKDLARDLNRPVSTLIALSANNDPFYASAPARLRDAEWFAELWDRFRLADRTQHLRRIHYFLVSTTAILTPDGSAYENTLASWQRLICASRDARYLSLVPIEAIEDRRNAEAVIYLAEPQDAELLIANAGEIDAWLLGFPALRLGRPIVAQHFHVEIWVEKSTMNDILDPLAQRYGVNLVYGVGEMSLTRCHQVVERAVASGRPVVILYISDFDPAGQSMPVAAARKIEFVMRTHFADEDIEIQLLPIALTHDQCVEYGLPRTPIKDTEKRAARFEERFGEGATELDALEALHPGEFERIVEEEILRYYDADLDDAVEQTAAEFSDRLSAINTDVRSRYTDEIAVIETDYKLLAARVNSLRQAMKDELEAAAPDIDEIDWPEPEEGDGDPDPLFDSTRDYVEQIDRFKEHQDKPTTRKRREAAE